MAKPIQSFPDGAAGAALALLRLSGGVIAWPTLAGLGPPLGDGWPGSAGVAALVALALLAGLCTRAAALTLVVLLGANLALGRGEALALLSASFSAASLALLGPGAFSIDARRFGRRVIRVGPTPPDGGRSDSPPSGLRKGKAHEKD